MSRPYHERTADGFVLCADPADGVRLGLLRGFLFPVLFPLLAGLFGLPFLDDAPSVSLSFLLISLPLGVAGSIWGFVQAARAGRSAEKTRVVWRDGTLRLADGKSVSKSAIIKVVADQPSKTLKWKAIRVVGTDGKLTLVLGGLPPGRGPEIAATAEALAAEIGVPVEADDARNATAGGIQGPTYAALCYMPVQGICLGASAIALLLSKDPLVRFCAKQSLLWFAVSTGAIFGAIALAIVPMVLLPEDVGPLVAIPFGLVAFALLLVRFGVFLFAAWRAWYGIPWLIPGLSAISRRWLPPTPGAAPIAEPRVDAGVWSPPVGG